MIKEKGKNWEDYEELMEDQILSEWNKCKPSSRDWQKIKVICFDDKGKPVVKKTDEYR